MKKAFAALILGITLIACQPENRVYVDHQELSPDLEWLKKDKRTFEVPVSDTSLAYNMGFTFRYANGYSYQVAMVKVTETDPEGNETVKEYDLKVREDNGDYIGEPGFDIWDSEHLVEAGKKYSIPGTYTYVIEQNTPVDPLNFAMELGVYLDKAQ